MKKLTKEDVDKMVMSYLDKSKGQSPNLLKSLMAKTRPKSEVEPKEKTLEGFNAKKP